MNMTDDQILRAAKRIRAKRAAAKKKGVRTREQVQALAKARTDEIERRCVDGDETMAHVARSMGVSGALVATRCDKIRRIRRRGSIPKALSGSERLAIPYDLSIRASNVIRNCGWNIDDNYMKLTMTDILKVPNAGRKTAHEIIAFQKRSKAFRDYQLSIPTEGSLT